jgi:hypothetical protein
MVQESDDFFDAPRRRYAALNRYLVDIAYSNLRFGFELARAKTFSEVLNLQAEYWRRLFNAFYRGEFRNWPVEAGEPGSPVDQDERPTGEHIPPQKARKTANALPRELRSKSQNKNLNKVTSEAPQNTPRRSRGKPKKSDPS